MKDIFKEQLDTFNDREKLKKISKIKENTENEFEIELILDSAQRSDDELDEAYKHGLLTNVQYHMCIKERLFCQKKAIGISAYKELIESDFNEKNISFETYIYRLLCSANHHWIHNLEYDYSDSLKLHIHNYRLGSRYGVTAADVKVDIELKGIGDFLSINFYCRGRTSEIDFSIITDSYNIKKYVDKDEILSNLKVKTKALPYYLK